MTDPHSHYPGVTCHSPYVCHLTLKTFPEHLAPASCLRLSCCVPVIPTLLSSSTHTAPSMSPDRLDLGIGEKRTEGPPTQEVAAATSCGAANPASLVDGHLPPVGGAVLQGIRCEVADLYFVKMGLEVLKCHPETGGRWVNRSVMVIALNHLAPFLGRRRPRGPSQEGYREEEGGRQGMRKEREKGWWLLPHAPQLQTKMERMVLPELPVIKGGVTQALLLLQVHRVPLRRAERTEPQFSWGIPPPERHPTQTCVLWGSYPH